MGRASVPAAVFASRCGGLTTGLRYLMYADISCGGGRGGAGPGKMINSMIKNG